VLPLVAGLVLAPLVGGRLSALGDLRLRLVGAFYAAIALQLVAFPFAALPWRTSDRAGVVLWLCSYGVLAVGAAANLRLTGMGLVLVGMLSNLAAILANGGSMPADPAALASLGLTAGGATNSVVVADPALRPLTDIFAMPAWLPLANVFSIGDVLIGAGIAIAIAVSMRRRPAGGREPAEDAVR
jgi:hypothetical protein